MNPNDPAFQSLQKLEKTIETGLRKWSSPRCDTDEVDMWQSFDFRKKVIRISKPALSSFESNWADSVPELISGLASQVQEKKNQELQLALVQALIQFAVDGLEKRMQRLESRQTIVVPIDSFTPEPYNVLKTILVTVNSVDGGFNAGWFDANIHFSGDNEQEAVSNLKGLILDIFESYSSEPPEHLGPEPTRQLAVMREHIQRKS